MVATTTTRIIEINLTQEAAQLNCPFREQVGSAEQVSHRCHLQDWTEGRPGFRDRPMTASCEIDSIAETCPLFGTKVTVGLR